MLPDELDISVPPAAHLAGRGDLRLYPQELGEPVGMRDGLDAPRGRRRSAGAAERLAQHRIVGARTRQPQVLHPALRQQELRRAGVQRAAAVA